ncbi:MAG: glycosyltransferase [Bacteroidetes bacterium]|nr:glycosyltransferase [Bacteroidota bacterium]
MTHQKKILIAPLDWGLGHATRCIPLISSFLNAGHIVHVAANQSIRTLLQTEFPELIFHDLPGYNIRYSAQKWMLPFTILKQVPQIVQAIRNEQSWLNLFLQRNAYDLIVSDNRYGFYHHSVKSVIITHQLQILVPQSILLQKILNVFNHRLLNHFKECWVADYETDSMSGKLSAKSIHIPIKYLGNLSRFKGLPEQTKKYDIIVILSGPEPQRTLLEEEILKQVKALPYKTIVVRGKPSEDNKIRSYSPTINIINHLQANELEMMIQSSEIIICRSGYSTMMDLIKLNRHALFIPTPGQTEQEYLAEYFSHKKWGMYSPQETLHLENLIQAFQTYPFEKYPNWNLYQYETLLEELG